MQRYWEPDFNHVDVTPGTRDIEEVAELLEASVKRQMRSDVPVGAYLSGGLDSSLVASLASRHTPHRLETFTGAFHEGPEFDETQHQLHDGQADPYARSRDFYLQRRQNEIDELKGKAPRNSSPMSEAPTALIEVRKRSSEISAEEAPPAAAPRITPPPVVRTLPEATQPAVSEPPAPAPGPVLPQGA